MLLKISPLTYLLRDVGERYVTQVFSEAEYIHNRKISYLSNVQQSRQSQNANDKYSFLQLDTH